MNKYGLIALSGVMALAAASCDVQLDITPKGQTTLSNVNDLETLLNQRFTIFTNPTEMEVLCSLPRPIRSITRSLKVTRA